MTTFKFILRRSTRGQAYAGSICIRLIHHRRVKVHTCPVNLYDYEWDEKLQQIVLPDKDDDRYAYLCEAIRTLEDYSREFSTTIAKLEQEGYYSLSDVVSAYRSLHCFTNLHGFIELQARKLLSTHQERTARAYRTAGRRLIGFNRGRDIPLRDINAGLIKSFETYLKDCGKSLNTISYYMRMLRAIYWKAVKEGLIEERKINPFEGVFTGVEQTTKRALDCDKLQSLHNLDFSFLTEGKPSPKESDVKIPDKGLYDSWRYFFFCFHARGMSFVDLAYLRKENIRQGVISYYRKKTGQKIEVTVSRYMQQIIDSFAAEVEHTPYLFPIIRDMDKSPRLQYQSGLYLQNKRLKRLAALAGISDKISTHVARHSWATIGKKQNLPLSVISEGLGHSSEKMTYTYLASFDRSTIDKASRCITRAVIRPRTTKNTRLASSESLPAGIQRFAGGNRPML